MEIVLVIGLVCGFITMYIFEKKQRSIGWGFFFGFLFGVLAVIIALFLPTKQIEEAPKARGQTYTSKTTSQWEVNSYTHRSRRSAQSIVSREQLSESEVQLLRAYSPERSLAAIATDVGTSQDEVIADLGRLRRKLGVLSNRELLQAAEEQDYLIAPKHVISAVNVMREG